jgi:hypothetical protein
LNIKYSVIESRANSFTFILVNRVDTLNCLCDWNKSFSLNKTINSWAFNVIDEWNVVPDRISWLPPLLCFQSSRFNCLKFLLIHSLLAIEDHIETVEQYWVLECWDCSTVLSITVLRLYCIWLHAPENRRSLVCLKVSSHWVQTFTLRYRILNLSLVCSFNKFS